MQLLLRDNVGNQQELVPLSWVVLRPLTAAPTAAPKTFLERNGATIGFGSVLVLVLLLVCLCHQRHRAKVKAAEAEEDARRAEMRKVRRALSLCCAVIGCAAA